MFKLQGRRTTLLTRNHLLLEEKGNTWQTWSELVQYIFANTTTSLCVFKMSPYHLLDIETLPGYIYKITLVTDSEICTTVHILTQSASRCHRWTYI